MFLLDNLLLAPATGMLALFREIHQAALQDADSEAEAVRNELGEIYMMLETGRISEEDFEQRERELLDRLDALEAEPEREEPAGGN